MREPPSSHSEAKWRLGGKSQSDNENASKRPQLKAKMNIKCHEKKQARRGQAKPQQPKSQAKTEAETKNRSQNYAPLEKPAGSWERGHRTGKTLSGAVKPNLSEFSTNTASTKGASPSPSNLLYGYSNCLAQRLHFFCSGEQHIFSPRLNLICPAIFGKEAAGSLLGAA